MKNSPRFIPSWPFPDYIFIPGQTPHPKKAGGHMEGSQDPVATQIDVLHPEKNDFLRFSLDLYNHHYFWESHVYFEALWNAHGRIGSVADLLKAFIKLAAAGVKLSLKQESNALAHFDRAGELLEAVIEKEGSEFLGFDLSSLRNQLSVKNIEGIKIVPSWS